MVQGKTEPGLLRLELCRCNVLASDTAMTSFRPGDMVLHGACLGKVIIAVPSGYDDELCSVQFGTKETWVMAHELVTVVENLPFVPRVVGGTDHHPDTAPSEIQP